MSLYCCALVNDRVRIPSIFLMRLFRLLDTCQKRAWCLLLVFFSVKSKREERKKVANTALFFSFFSFLIWRVYTLPSTTRASLLTPSTSHELVCVVPRELSLSVSRRLRWEEHFHWHRAARTYVRLWYSWRLSPGCPFSAVTIELSIRAISAQLGLSFAFLSLFLSLHVCVSFFREELIRPF